MGILIVLEGLDGSGKGTQTELLKKHLEAKNKKVRVIDFPDYSSEGCTLVKMYLGGKLGDDPDDTNAYAASMFYAMDRYASYKQDWGDFYENGGLIIANRYTTSNAVHQASKLLKSDRKQYLDWLFHLEYELLGLPKPDLVIYLDMPTEITERMMRQREKATGTSADIHEQDEVYLKNCRANAKNIVKECGWLVINCAKNGEPRTLEDIHAQVYRTVKRQLL